MVESTRRVPVAAALLAALLVMLSAIALSAYADAETVNAEWRIEGSKQIALEPGEEVWTELHGFVYNESKLEGSTQWTFGCGVDADLVVGGPENSGEGTIENIIFNPGSCEGTGQMKGCELAKSQDLTVDATHVQAQQTEKGYVAHLDDLDFAWTDFVQGCMANNYPLASREALWGYDGALDISPDSSSLISKFTLSQNHPATPAIYTKGSLNVTPSKYLSIK